MIPPPQKKDKNTLSEVGLPSPCQRQGNPRFCKTVPANSTLKKNITCDVPDAMTLSGSDITASPVSCGDTLAFRKNSYVFIP